MTNATTNRFEFDDLAIGAEFEFASIEDFPFSGMQRGPWRKVSARKYVLVSDASFICRVGSKRVETIPVLR